MPQQQIYDIAWPIGRGGRAYPSTNPTSTVMFKTLIAVKARNAIVVAPHPAATQLLCGNRADHGRGRRAGRHAEGRWWPA